jgi:ribose 5-phosphate isomerase A
MVKRTTDELAAAGVQEIRTGMTVGLGTGRTATRAIESLARRVSVEGLNILCVATSQASDVLGRKLGLRMQVMEAVERIDYLFDGADEVDASMRMIKGRGGAMTREKIAARAATRRVYLLQSAKLVDRLGAAAPLPIEVLRFGLAATRRALGELGLDGAVRGAGYTTDDGNPVVDASLPAGVDLAQLATALDQTPGIVGHGLFLTEADVLLIEDPHGRVSRRTRASA